MVPVLLASLLACSRDAGEAPGPIAPEGEGTEEPCADAGAPELCDGLDNDCDLEVDEGLPALDGYLDLDGDGFGDVSTLVRACAVPPDRVADGTDCDDADELVRPDAQEVCDGLDNDCDGDVDDLDPSLDDATRSDWYVDGDADGYGVPGMSQRGCAGPAGSAPNDDDCDDDDDLVSPAATEVCFGVDEDCDGLLDDGDPSLDPASTSTWYIDADADGYGSPALTADSCVPDAIHVGNDDDCDDGNARITVPQDSSADLDGDRVGDGVSLGFGCFPPSPGDAPVPLGPDCDDLDPLRFPGNPEVCEDGIDNDCNAATTDACTLFVEDFEDGDYAGWTEVASGQTPSIDAIGALGTTTSFRIDSGSSHFRGIYWPFSPAVRPSVVRYHVRTDGVTGDRGYLVFGGAPIENANTVAFCWFSADMLQCYDGTVWYSTPLTVGAWHEVVLTLDWTAQTLDFAVDGALVAASVPFRGVADEIAELHLYNYSGPTAWWDQIELYP